MPYMRQIRQNAGRANRGKEQNKGQNFRGAGVALCVKMYFKKQGFPDEEDLVLCTVTSVQYHSVFVNLDEYGKAGMIHISEVSPGRIRNIRDFVKEGKKVVCKVLRINQERGHIDLSLRRVNESEKRNKIEEIKKEQDAEKIVDISASRIGIKSEQLYNSISGKILKKYKSLHACFDDFIRGNIKFEELGIDAKYVDMLSESIRQRMKVPEVSIGGKLKISLYSPRGIDIIKEALKKIESVGDGSVDISYLGSGAYRVIVKAADYKEAEKRLKEGIGASIDLIKKEEGEAEFIKSP